MVTARVSSSCQHPKYALPGHVSCIGFTITVAQIVELFIVSSIWNESSIGHLNSLSVSQKSTLCLMPVK